MYAIRSYYDHRGGPGFRFGEALTVYDMCKAVDRWMSIREVRLLEKRGGKSGTVRRPGGGP